MSSCAHHPTCPGCPLRDTPYADQRAAKRHRLQAALDAFPHLALQAPAVRPALHEDAYRHRLKLPVARRGGRVAIGLSDPRTGQVLDTPDCPVLVDPLRDGLQAVHRWVADHPDVHSVDLRWSDATGTAQLVLACRHGSLKGGKAALAGLHAAWPALRSVAVSTADPEGKRVMGRNPHRIDGLPHVEEAVGTTRYRLYPGAFFQVDPRNAVQLHDLVRGFVGDAPRILDLYAGVGAYALALAEGREQVIAVEEVPQAAEAARAMAPPNVRVLTARVEDLPLDRPVDVAILNPARRGADPSTLGRLAACAERLVYVSCGPETLARDLDVLAAHGFRVAGLEAVDLFPQTPEVETVAHLIKARPLRTWPTPGGRAGGPWTGRPSGAVGRADEAVALVLGDTGPGGRTPVGPYERLAVVAGHSLVKIGLHGPLEVALRTLAKARHPVAGLEPRTARFFADKAGLVRPFVHVMRSGRAFAPLHGDLVLALEALGAPPPVITALAPDR